MIHQKNEPFYHAYINTGSSIYFMMYSSRFLVTRHFIWFDDSAYNCETLTKAIAYLVESKLFIDFPDCRWFTREYSANTHSIWRWIDNFWDVHCNDTSAQSHEQPTGCVYSKCCFRIANSARNTSNAWLKSADIPHFGDGNPYLWPKIL